MIYYYLKATQFIYKRKSNKKYFIFTKKQMTTITNFLNTNFLNPATITSNNSNGKSENETPVWVINGTRDNKISTLKQYMI